MGKAGGLGAQGQTQLLEAALKFKKQTNKHEKCRLFHTWAFQAAETNASFHNQQVFIFTLTLYP